MKKKEIKKKIGEVKFQSWLPEKEKKGISVTDARFDEIFGASDFTEKPSKNWKDHLPLKEIQAFGDCVSFSRLNCAETKARKEDVKDDEGNEFNFSDLDLAVGSGTTEKGNSLKAVAEYGRKTGVSLEKDCPYTYSWPERQIRFNNAKNKKKYKLGNWSWINTPTNSLKNALELTPIQIAIGVGNNYNNEGIIKDPKIYQGYHAVTCYFIDAIGNKDIYDHYDKEWKTLDKDYNVFYAMSYADLPQDWKGKNSDDTIFYKRMVGKFILRTESAGELYEIGETKIVKVHFKVSNKKIWDIIQKALRPAITGINENDFKRLEKVAFTMEGILPADKEINIKGLLDI